MTPDACFRVTNTVALAAWIALVAFPNRRIVSGLLCGIVVPGLLALTYAAVVGWKFASGGPPPGDLMTREGVQALFADDWVFAAAWIHYLAFDMVAGAWIARDATRLALPRGLLTASLVLTFLAGPIGFLTHILGRWALRGNRPPRAGATAEHGRMDHPSTGAT